MNIYVGGRKETLIALLETALDNLRAATEGSVSVALYATPGEGSITFTDEDTAGDYAGEITIEE